MTTDTRDRPVCGHPQCTSPAAKRYDRPGKFRRWCDAHCRRTRRARTHVRGRPPTVPQPPNPLAPDARMCPMPGCIRLKELRRHRIDGTPVFRWTCQAHRGAVPDRVTPPPPEPKARIPWKPVPASPHATPTPASTTKGRTPSRGRTHAPLANTPITRPAAVITTANDGTWALTRDDLRFVFQHTGRPAFEVCMSPQLSRPIPTSVVYRVWGMMERGELTVEGTL